VAALARARAVFTGLLDSNRKNILRIAESAFPWRSAHLVAAPSQRDLSMARA
jgi:hypothetical protein